MTREACLSDLDMSICSTVVGFLEGASTWEPLNGAS